MASADSADCLPVFDLTSVVGKAPDEYDAQDEELCRGIAECLHKTGCLIVRDPRVPNYMNEHFLDLLERYFEQPADRKMADCRPALDYQVGVTPCGTEVPRCLVDPQLQDQLRRLQPPNRPTLPTGADLKWRYFWRVGPRPPATAFPELNAEPVVPTGFPDWAPTMDAWGSALLGAAQAVAGLLGRGLGLPERQLQDVMSHGPHLLAPTASDLDCNGRLGAVLAGYHYDLNLLTVHGRSRFPGLFVWLRDGRRVPVRIPEGCLLMQAGKQLEWLTAGHIMAGFHEVVVVEPTLAAVERARAAGRSTWRISSTVFTHAASDTLLAPLGPFATAPGAAAYPPTRAGEQVQRELEAICLRKQENHAPPSAAAAAASGTAAPSPSAKGGSMSNSGSAGSGSSSGLGSGLGGVAAGLGGSSATGVAIGGR
ncbi:hypothetical protein HYH03_004808 [Edaphochlamys debaryana]|uniref:Uncharacterized protein n=1 Tax=Edaphochlamys debaryana TaxID=47281 RepID=A0A835Y8R9_9CHLO|nr:hypothetical protein HYH03_004808 [Edaphochlamys debaryana]|eukprot:KAG2497219.1 hypothetical protein HYH03_004808 [Edaphochlamys debaryana]